MTTTITKGVAGNQDLSLYDGVNNTFTREDSSGNTLTLNTIGNVVDVLASYGAGVNYNSTTVNAALTAISTNKMTLVLHPGTWTMNADITIPATVDLHCPKGVVITTTGYTLTVNGIISGWPTFSGSGTVTINYTSVASAATINLAALASNFVHVTGSTGPVTSLGSVPYGKEFTLVFDSTPTLTHNATSLILPGAGNITATAGDVFRFRSEGSGNWRCIAYIAAAGTTRTILGIDTNDAVTFGNLTATSLVTSGKIQVANNIALYWKNAAGTEKIMMYLTSGDILAIGTDLATGKLHMNIDGTLRLVSLGANDSGATGYRYLRVPNA